MSLRCIWMSIRNTSAFTIESQPLGALQCVHTTENVGRVSKPAIFFTCCVFVGSSKIYLNSSGSSRCQHFGRPSGRPYELIGVQRLAAGQQQSWCTPDSWEIVYILDAACCVPTIQWGSICAGVDTFL
jgi:hypothetical protein